MGQLFSKFNPRRGNKHEDIWGIPSPRIEDTCHDDGASPPPSRLSAEETYKEIITAFNDSYPSGGQWTPENFIWDTNEAAALVDTAHNHQTNPPHSASSTRMLSPKAVANNSIVTTFDDFLNSGDFCSLKNFAWDPNEAAALRLVDIRDWHNNATHLEPDFGFNTEFLDRRTNLWKLALFQESLPLDKRYLAPFIAPSAHTSRVAPYILCAPNARLPLQQLHISHHAIPAALADIRANDAAQLLAYLNDICETAVALTPDLHAFLDARTQRKWDVGTVYGSVRVWWADFALGRLTLEIIESRMHACENQGKILRGTPEPTPKSGKPTTKRVWASRIPPRRIWDLYSNRVLPYHVFASPLDPIPTNVWAVSHSWVGAAERTAVWTSVNGRRWPVPLPTDVSLEQVRIELLNMGAEYVFLDVLCLKQPDSLDAASEDTRRREWELDVPTLGHIYRHTRNQTVVVYFNGLGRPFDAEGSRLASPLHWLNRAWTLQETTLNWLPGGLTTKGCTRWNGCAFLQRLHDAQHALGLVGVTREPEFVGLLREMQGRPGYADKKPYDRVAALAYLIPRHRGFEVYTESTADAEEMWQNLVSELPERDRFYLLLFGAGGDTSRTITVADARRYWESRRKGQFLLWRPTWYDIMRYPEDMPRELSNCFTKDDEMYRHDQSTFWAVEVWYCHRAYVVKDPTIINNRIVVTAGNNNHTQTAENTFTFKTNFGLEYAPPYANDSSSQRLVLIGIGGLECWLLCVTRLHETVDTYNGPALAVYQKLGVFNESDSQVRRRIKEKVLGEYRWVAYCDKVRKDLW